MIDAEARRRIAEDLETSLVVEAAAGTGKTTALIGRMIAILRSGRARLEEGYLAQQLQAAAEAKLEELYEETDSLSATEFQRRLSALTAALSAARQASEAALQEHEEALRSWFDQVEAVLAAWRDSIEEIE